MSAPAGTGSPFPPLVGAGWLAERLGDPDLVVVDVRFDLFDPGAGREQYLEGHIPGAVFADIEEDLSGRPDGTNGRHPLPPAPEAAAVFSRLGIGPDTTVIAADEISGMFASRLFWMLRQLGHGRTAVLDGGVSAWKRSGGELRAGAETRPEANFLPAPVPELSVSVEEVEAGLATGRHLLLDAREPERFRGETEPIDPVAGRIPGARNHPWKGNLGPDGCLLDRGRLRERFAALARAQGDRRIVCYCGSGLTAAQNALALTVAGFSGVAVHAGSWSEWCADPGRPVETGASPGT